MTIEPDHAGQPTHRRIAGAPEAITLTSRARSRGAQKDARRSLRVSLPSDRQPARARSRRRLDGLSALMIFSMVGARLLAVIAGRVHLLPDAEPIGGDRLLRFVKSHR